MSSRVLVALRVEASQQDAFDVFVDDIGEWWRANPLFRTGARRPGRMHLARGRGGALTETTPDGEICEIGRVLHWEPPERLTLSWHQPDFPDGLATEVDVHFERVGETATRVRVEHRGFHRVPADSAARHGFPDGPLQLRLAEWWRDLLSALARRCAERAR